MEEIFYIHATFLETVSYRMTLLGPDKSAPLVTKGFPLLAWIMMDRVEAS